MNDPDTNATPRAIATMESRNRKGRARSPARTVFNMIIPGGGERRYDDIG